ncbi:MAG: hypothetical protein RL385_2454 [Pseudomonadota bacterium]|jgi:hypothetical protein
MYDDLDLEPLVLAFPCGIALLLYDGGGFTCSYVAWLLFGEPVWLSVAGQA